MTPDPAVRLRSTPAARVVEHQSVVKAYPEPHAVPVLPPGWAPIEPSDEAAVLEACDQYPNACRLRLGSLWDANSEYRVYCLEGNMWGGVYAATVFACDRNGRLLAITDTPEEAANVALDFLNWDIETLGLNWRLALTGVHASD